MTQPKGKQQRRRFKTAITVAAVGLFGATAGVVVAADKSASPTDQVVAVTNPVTSQSSFYNGVVTTPTPSTSTSTTRQSTTTTTRRTLVVPFPNARTRAS